MPVTWRGKRCGRACKNRSDSAQQSKYQQHPALGHVLFNEVRTAGAPLLRGAHVHARGLLAIDDYPPRAGRRARRSAARTALSVQAPMTERGTQTECPD